MSEESRPQVTVKDVNAALFIKVYAAHLKKSGKLDVPSWTDYCKTGFFKEGSPLNPDWYYIRTASLARKIYLNNGVGIGHLRRMYGGSNRRGVRPNHFATASGGIIRHCLQNLEKLKVVEVSKSTKGGRVITSSGQRDLDRIAGRVRRLESKLTSRA